MRTLLPTLLVLLAVPASAQRTPAVPDSALADVVTVSGVVTDAETGDPVVGAGVVLPELGLGAVSQRDGSYAIEGVPAGTHAVRAAAYTYHFETVEAEVGEAPVALDFALHPGSAAGCASHDH